MPRQSDNKKRKEKTKVQLRALSSAKFEGLEQGIGRVGVGEESYLNGEMEKEINNERVR